MRAFIKITASLIEGADPRLVHAYALAFQISKPVRHPSRRKRVAQPACAARQTDAAFKRCPGIVQHMNVGIQQLACQPSYAVQNDLALKAFKITADMRNCLKHLLTVHSLPP